MRNTNGRAQEILNEQLDSVRRMNQLVMAYKCDRIRQKQIQQKAEIYDEERQMTINLDQLMEIERLKKVFQEQRVCQT